MATNTTATARRLLGRAALAIQISATLRSSRTPHGQRSQLDVALDRMIRPVAQAHRYPEADGEATLVLWQRRVRSSSSSSPGPRVATTYTPRTCRDYTRKATTSTRRPRTPVKHSPCTSRASTTTANNWRAMSSAAHCPYLREPAAPGRLWIAAGRRAAKGGPGVGTPAGKPRSAQAPDHDLALAVPLHRELKRGHPRSGPSRRGREPRRTASTALTAPAHIAGAHRLRGPLYPQAVKCAPDPLRASQERHDTFQSTVPGSQESGPTTACATLMTSPRWVNS